LISDSRAQRLVDEFEDAAYLASGGFSIPHGIAAVLRHLADVEGLYADDESSCAVPVGLLNELVDKLTEPSLLERAMKGDAVAAKQFLHEAGFTDRGGNWLPQYQSASS
jgi:hypothetical protein